MATDGSALDRLVAAVTAAVGAADPVAADPVAAVTAVLSRRVADPDLLDASFADPGPDGSREQVLHVDPDGRFSVLALVWSGGAATPPHDHRAWGVVGINRGVEVETRYAWSADGDRLVERGVTRATAGHVEGFTPPGDIHVVRQEGEQVAVSVHVYGTDVTRSGSSVRRIYAL